MQDGKRDTDVKKRHLHYEGEGKGGVIWENSIETCIQMTSANSMQEAGHPKLGLWDRPEGWGGEREGGLKMCLLECFRIFPSKEVQSKYYTSIYFK